MAKLILKPFKTHLNQLLRPFKPFLKHGWIFNLT